MGCSSSKKLIQLPPINSNFTTVHRDDLDDFFKRASKLLQVMETLRQRIVVTKEKCVALAGTKNLQGLGYSKAVEVLFWSISACDQGFIYRSNIEVIDKNPYFTLNTVGFPKETIDLVQTVKEYLFILNESSDTLQTAVWQLQQLKEEQIEKKKDIDPKLNSKTKKTIDANMKKLTDGTTISAKVLSQIPEEQKDARELIKYMQGLLATADDLGAKAHTAGKLKPIDIYKWSEAEKRKEEKKARSASKGKGSKSSSPAKSLQPALKNNTDKKEPDSAKRVEFADNKLQNQATIKADLLQEELDEKTFKDDKVFEHQGSIHGHNNLMDDPNEIGIHNFGGLKASQGHAPNSTMNNSQSSPGVSGKGHKYIFVGEKSLEVALRENQVDEQGKIKSSGGYLSPGGRKQAGILQIDENVVDDDDEHGLANDSDALKRFTEKARSYLTTKDE